MKPAPFEYFAPTSIDETLALLSEHGDEAKLLAGGQSLVPAMNFRLARPAVLVDLNRVPELAFIAPRSLDGADDPVGDPGSEIVTAGGQEKRQAARTDDDGTTAIDEWLAIGAMTRQTTLERSAEVARFQPLLAAALPHIAHPQIRNRGTLGGSLAHADPAAELPAVAMALEARIVVRGAQGERRHDADDFFRGLFATALQPTEILSAVEFPALPRDTGWSFQEIARRHGDYALVGVAVVLRLSDDLCEAARIVLFAVGTGPTLAVHAGESLVGATIDEARIREAARRAAHDDVAPIGDIHASTAYRRRLVEVLVRRAMHEAASRARTWEAR